jgi:hypothetical protein
MLEVGRDFRRSRRQSKKAGYNLRLCCSWMFDTNLLPSRPPLPPLPRNASAAALTGGARAQPRVGGLLCTPSRYRTPRVAGRATITAPPTCPRARARARALSTRACESRGVRGRGVSILPLAHARRPLAGSTPRLECGDNPNLNPKLNTKP